MKKSHQYLSKFDLMSGVNLKKDSADWLVACLDPYHDYQIEPHGLPDERTAPSVVQVHNQTYTLTKPTSAGVGNWDASVMFSGFNSVINPLSLSSGMVTMVTSTNHLYTSLALDSGTPFGALNIWAGAAGSSMSTGTPITAGDSYYAMGSVQPTDRCRLIGVAFEIHNTTAEIYQQGSLTVAQLPDAASDACLVRYHDVRGEGAYNDFFFQADRAMLQACTSQPLTAVPGSQTWPAAEGCYCIPRMAEIPHTINSFAYAAGDSGEGTNTRVPILYGTDGKTATPEPSGGVETTAGYNPVLYPRFPSGFSPVQVFLTGLSNQTTLTITFRSVVEYFPALTSVLLPLSTPSSEYDPRAFEAYSLLISKIPYATKVDDNAGGDYFRKVVAAMRSVIGRAGPALTALAPMLGPYGGLASAAGTFLTERQNKRAAK